MWINLERDGLGIVAFHLEGGSRVGSHQEPQVHGLNQKLNKTSGSRGGSTYAAVSAPLSYPDLRAYAHSDASESSEIDYGTKLVVNLSCAACMWNECAGRQYIVCLQKLLIIFFSLHFGLLHWGKVATSTHCSSMWSAERTSIE
jgi:hypothetical protein